MQLNGKTRTLDAPVALSVLLAEAGFDGEATIAVERNGEIVRRADHATTMIVDDDVLEVVRFVGGG